MKTPEEIKRGLKQCYTIGTLCYGCPNEIYKECNDILALDANTYIEQLEEQVSLMKIQMRGDCGTCKHKEERGQICYECMEKAQTNKTNWEYEGLPEIGR